jgi:hypothetical protein
VKGRRKDYLVLDYSNFGLGKDCRACEWSEIYSLDGKLVASSPAFADSLSTAKRKSAAFDTAIKREGIELGDATSTTIDRLPDTEQLQPLGR